ncbi:MAG: hypothetical protein BMS9Abin31_0218 [Gammaproteobacteria bacterium]|nr:MAG: hypothetical protein BMS9Abin31_0218 [Gammaproteobacteria bacterium]
MIGKKNIVFGFIFFAFTASLGAMMVNMYEEYGVAAGEKQTSVGRLSQLKTDGFEEELEPLNAKQIAMANTDGILSMSKLSNVEFGIDYIKGGPHAHGNLESLLNIVAGFILCFVSIAVWQKQLLSWGFIVGTLLHSGMLFLERVFAMEWAGQIVATGIGPVLILASLFFMGIAVAKGFKTEMVKD